jgi:hypothetical protein
MPTIAHVHVQAEDRNGETCDAVKNALFLHGYSVEEITRDHGPLDISLPEDLPENVRHEVWAAAEKA